MIELHQNYTSAQAAPDWPSNFRRTLGGLERLSDFQAGVVIFSLSLATRFAVMFWSHTVEVLKTESINVAINLANSGKFANPFLTAATGPTAHLAPVYPFLLSLVYRLVGGGVAFFITLHVFSAVLVSLQFALLPYASRSLKLPWIAGFIAGICAAALPLRMWLETSGGNETVLTGLVCIALVAWTIQLSHCIEVPLWQKALCGFAWGMAFLINPIFIPMLVGILIVLFVTSRSRPVKSLTIVVLGCSLLTICPWIIRNYLALGKFSPIRDNFGLELSVSNDDQATAIMDWNVDSPTFLHPFSNPTEGLRMQAMGETAYYHLRMQEALLWIRSHPGRFLKLTVQRLLFFWLSPANGKGKNLFLLVLTLLGVAGLVVLWTHDRAAAAIFLAMWLTYQMPYYFVQVSPRYRYPIDWTFWLLSAYAVWSIQARRKAIL